MREKTRSRPRVAVVGTLDPREAGEGKEATMMSLNCRMVGVGSLREEATKDASLHRSMYVRPGTSLLPTGLKCFDRERR